MFVALDLGKNGTLLPRDETKRRNSLLLILKCIMNIGYNRNPIIAGFCSNELPKEVDVLFEVLASPNF